MTQTALLPEPTLFERLTKAGVNMAWYKQAKERPSEILRFTSKKQTHPTKIAYIIAPSVREMPTYFKVMFCPKCRTAAVTDMTHSRDGYPLLKSEQLTIVHGGFPRECAALEE